MWHFCKHRDTWGKTGRCDCLCCAQNLLSFTITIPLRWVHRTKTQYFVTYCKLVMTELNRKGLNPNKAVVLFAYVSGRRFVTLKLSWFIIAVILCNLSLPPSWVNLIHFLSCVTCQDDISPAGGFSLRGCLVSSLEDNGVPSGESLSQTPVTTQKDFHFKTCFPL